MVGLRLFFGSVATVYGSQKGVGVEEGVDRPNTLGQDRPSMIGSGGGRSRTVGGLRVLREEGGVVHPLRVRRQEWGPSWWSHHPGLGGDDGPQSVLPERNFVSPVPRKGCGPLWFRGTGSQPGYGTLSFGRHFHVVRVEGGIRPGIRWGL